MTGETERVRAVRELSAAFARGDRDAVEALLAPEFRFSAPPDPDLDRAGFFEKCWPFAGNGRAAEFVRVVESGDEVIFTYENPNDDGSRGRNTEVLTFSGDQVVRQEVYWGWTVPAS